MARGLAKIDDKPTKRQTEKCRAAIQTTNLVHRVQGMALGTIAPNAIQLKAALGLLSKTLPDLTSTQIEDVTPDYGRPQEVQEAWQDLLRQQIHQMNRDELLKLLETN